MTVLKSTQTVTHLFQIVFSMPGIFKTWHSSFLFTVFSRKRMPPIQKICFYILVYQWPSQLLLSETYSNCYQGWNRWILILLTIEKSQSLRAVALRESQTTRAGLESCDFSTFWRGTCPELKLYISSPRMWLKMDIGLSSKKTYILFWLESWEKIQFS